MKLFELKEVVFFLFCDTKRVAGIIVLQKLRKALVHSGDVTMNLCFFKGERGDCIQVMVFLGVMWHKRQGAWLRARSQVSEGWRFSSFLHTQTPPGVHSAYYKMSTRG